MQNPVILKELRSRMRGNRTFVILTLYLFMLSGIILLTYLGFESSNTGGLTLSVRQTLGKTIFGLVTGFQLMTVSFISPALTAGAIASEREQQTLDLLRTTLLPARSLVLGKLNTALYFVFLLLFATLPIQSIAFLVGGVTVVEFVVGTLLVFVSAVAYSATGIFFSSFTRRTLIATVLSYAFTIMLFFGLPFLILMFTGMFGAGISGSGGAMSDVLTILAGIMLYLMIAVNPVATIIASEIILLEEQTVVFFMFPITNTVNFPVISPWIVYTLLYTLISLLLIFVSIQFVRRVES
jgi:ABC-type transport system involved in multi-copper enzyme maturation permease subunit